MIRKRVILFFIFFIFAGYSFCQEFFEEIFVESEDKIIKEIRFEGLKRTKESYAQEIFAEFKGKKEDEIDFEKLNTLLYSCSLFSDFKSEIIEEEDFKILLIAVTEKVYFLPLPFATFGSDSKFSAGLFLMDTNTFGRQNMFAVGGIYSKETKMGMLMFLDPGAKKLGWSVNFSAGYSNDSFCDEYGETYFEYKHLNLSTGFSILKRIKKFSLSTGASYQFSRPEFEDEESPELNHIGALNFGLRWSGEPHFTGYFLNNTSVRTDGSLFYSSKEHFGQKITAQASSYLRAKDNLRVFASIAGGFENSLPITELFTKNSSGISILPSNLKSEKIASAASGLEWAFAKTKFGVFSLYNQYELCGLEDYIAEDYEFFHGVAGGLRIYITKISMPAFSCLLAYNISTNSLKFAMSVGMSF